MRTEHSNISIFIPHLGCPQNCSFCDQRVISGEQKAPSAQEVEAVCRDAFEKIKNKDDTEIAFFGGSFTAIDRDYMVELLDAAGKYVGEGRFHGIRISTRPDFIDDEVLGILKDSGVTSIELGAQSMNDKVLSANDRGHTAQDVRDASKLIRAYGFELGLQIMPGLYGSSPELDMETVHEAVKLRPDTVRIYPVVVLGGTRLAQLYHSGEYRLTPFDDMVRLCAEMMMIFRSEGIRVIKCGLHASDGVSGERVAGYYHPAFRELCEGYIFRGLIEKALGGRRGRVNILVSRRDVSKAVGQKKANIEYFKKMGADIMISGSDAVQELECRIKD